MYRLVLYCLTAWIIIALILSAFGLLSFSPLALLYSTLIILIVSWITNELFARVWKTHANVESIYITAFILVCLITPPSAGSYVSILPFLIWASILSMSSKYILAISKKHLFNPAAIALVITALFIGESATWWIGTLYMLPFVLLGGLLIVRKIKRFDLFLPFFGAAIITILATTNTQIGLGDSLLRIFANTPIVFFATVMLTEPLTTPPARTMRIIYGIIVGILFSPNIHIGSIYSTPELALVIGNIFSWLASPKAKYLLRLKRKDSIALLTGEFAFETDRPLPFVPGQYLEWTLSHKDPDSRGDRRYLTIASSPTEKDIKIGIKFDPKRSSSFKKALAHMEAGETILAGQLSGEFTMPKDQSVKLCFIAGGIGITPFRSMIAYLLDSDEKRDVILMYSAKEESELSYLDLWEDARKSIGLKTVLTVSSKETIRSDWPGCVGFINEEMIRREVPDYMERMFFVSGPHSLVTAIESCLKKMSVPKKNIKTDYFPGFA